MKIEFTKYHGTGNDFILLDNRNFKYSGLAGTQIKKLCDRHFGIGADGLMLLQNSSDYNFEMKYYNSDGNEGSMCGNGGRCIVAFAKLLKILQNSAKFLAIDGKHEALIDDRNFVILKMKSINIKEVTVENEQYIIDTGSPHLVKYLDKVETMDVFAKGRKIRNSNRFINNGINVNFVKIIKENCLFVRTYERGVENETLSCGTGAVACAVRYFLSNKYTEIKEIEIDSLGGKLYVDITFENENILNISLKGSTKFVFQGVIEV